MSECETGVICNTEGQGPEASLGNLTHRWNARWVVRDGKEVRADVLWVSGNIYAVDTDIFTVSANVDWVCTDHWDVLRHSRYNWCQLSSATWEVADSNRLSTDGQSQRSQVGWVDAVLNCLRDNADTEGVDADGRGVELDLWLVWNNLHFYWSKVSFFVFFDSADSEGVGTDTRHVLADVLRVCGYALS